MKQIAFTWLLCILSICAYAQQITVTGTVTDAENNPLIGAAVVVVGTTDGVITDFDGKYTIKAAFGQSLNFSYVGYREQTVKVDGRSVINVKLSEGELLDEVVVIGYGTVKKSHLTGAVASVSGKELQANVARSASAALQGRVAGVTVSAANGQPGEGLNINVRGISSLSATSPLYVIDGVYGDINMVDPADIQSIEVLKDASAAAIYGSRAANGVVLVTTKGGRLETSARVTVDAYTGVQMVAKYIDVMDGNQLRDLAKATGYSSAEGLLNWNGGAGTDWQKELYNSAMVSKVSLNVSGGNKTSTYNLSGSYLNQDGIVNTTGYEAWNIRAKNTFSFFNNHLRMGTTLMMKFYKKKYEDVSYTSALTAVPMWNVYGEDGTWGVAPEWKAEHVFVIGLDGWGAYSVAKADMPNVKALMDAGCYTLKKRSVLPSSSAVNWASMFMGAGPELHGYTEWGSRTPELPSRVLNEHGIFPTVFSELRKAAPDAEMGVLYEWDGIKYLVDTLALNHHAQAPDYNTHPTALCDMACEYITQKKPVLSAFCFDNPDHVGHGDGHDTPAYYAKLKELDGYVGRIVDAIKEAGIYENSIIIVTADHGGINKGHGGKTMEEMETPFIIAGKNIKKGGAFEESMMQFDCASTIASVFNLEQPQVWIGRPMTQVFE